MKTTVIVKVGDAIPNDYKYIASIISSDGVLLLIYEAPYVENYTFNSTHNDSCGIIKDNQLTLFSELEYNVTREFNRIHHDG